MRDIGWPWRMKLLQVTPVWLKYRQKRRYLQKRTQSIMMSQEIMGILIMMMKAPR
jgi:hypothetical protein